MPRQGFLWNTFKVISQNNDQNLDASIIWSSIILKMGKDEISKQFKVSPSYVRTLSRKFVANSKIRAQANRCHFNKKRILTAEHLEFLREAICQINSSPQKVSSLKHKLLSNFEGLKDISDSTVRRSLKAQLNMSYMKITVMNPKALISEKIDKMIRSGALLKILSDY